VNQPAEPFSAVITAAICSARASRRELRRRSTEIRAAGGVFGQVPSSKAARATATARSTSAGRAWAARPTSDSSCGDRMSSRSGLLGSVHVPPMNSLS
jgi:hypothetical protein